VLVPRGVNYEHEGALRLAVVEHTTATYLSVLGLRPSLGRWFTAAEDTRGAAVVVNDLGGTVQGEGRTTKAADAVHATKAGGKGWRVVVKGEYLALAAGGRGKVKRDYEAEFVLPNLDAALSIIKNKLLDSALRKKYPDFVAARTNKIVDARPLSPETPASRNLQYMNRAQLEAHVQEIRAPISIQDYPDVTDLRDAVIDYTQTPKGFAEREALRQKDRAEDRELRALNPEIELNTGA